MTPASPPVALARRLVEQAQQDETHGVRARYDAAFAEELGLARWSDLELYDMLRLQLLLDRERAAFDAVDPDHPGADARATDTAPCEVEPCTDWARPQQWRPPPPHGPAAATAGRTPRRRRSGISTGTLVAALVCVVAAVLTYIALQRPA